MASSMYDSGRNEFARGEIPWLVATTNMRCSLINTSYTGNVSHTAYSDCSANLVGTTGSMTLIAPTAGVCDASDQTYTAVTGSAVDKVVLYWLGTLNSITNPLVCWIEFSSVTPNGGDITIQWDNGSNKIFKL